MRPHIFIAVIIFCAAMIFYAENAWTARGGGGGGGPTVTLTKNADIDFGGLDFDATHNGSLRLGTNGSLSLTGSGLSMNNSGNAGSITITSPSGIVEIKCEQDGKMRNGNNNLDVINIEIAIDNGVSFGSGTRCQGIKKSSTVASTVDLAVNPSPVVFIGGEVSIAPGSLTSGAYSTASGGGDAITIRVVFQ